MVGANGSKYKKLYTSEIIIWCAGQYGNEILVQAQKLGWNICCFCDMQKEKQGENINNIPVYSFDEAYEKHPCAVVVIAHSNYSECLRIGRKLEKQKFKKNDTYFIAIELEQKGILPISKAAFCMNGKEIILLGPSYLCEHFIEWIGDGEEQIEICPSENDIEAWKQKFPNALWIPLHRDPIGFEQEKKVNWYHDRLTEKNVLFTEWFLTHFDYCDNLGYVETESDVVNTSVKKVVFNILSCNSGNAFLDGILDSHPNILYFGLDMCVWTNGIWDIIQIAKKEKGVEIAERIVEKIKEYSLNAWEKKIYTVSCVRLPNQDLKWLDEYRQALCDRMNEKRKYTEKEIFVNMHLAWKEANHQTVSGNETVIYLDIHGVFSPMEDWCMIVRWLEKLGFEIFLIQMIRRPYSQSASVMKMAVTGKRLHQYDARCYLEFVAYEQLYGELKEYPIIRMRFEDVKQYPEIVLKKLCRKLGIPWSERMLEITAAGKTIECICRDDVSKGYDMKSVWYPYDEFFDAFDKFRIDILCKEKCKAYDYPYVMEEKYPMPIDEVIELFNIPFRFEEYIDFASEEEKKNFRQMLKEDCRRIIYWQKNGERKDDLFCFGPYLNAVWDEE